MPECLILLRRSSSARAGSPSLLGILHVLVPVQDFLRELRPGLAERRIDTTLLVDFVFSRSGWCLLSDQERRFLKGQFAILVSEFGAFLAVVERVLLQRRYNDYYNQFSSNRFLSNLRL